MINIAICDDDEKYRNEIKALTDSFMLDNKKDYDIDCFSNGSLLLAEKKKYDIYFLDIIMPLINGIEVARKIRETDCNAVIIYLTTSDEFALSAFEVDAMQYILKPYNKEKIFSVLLKALSSIETVPDEKLVIETNNGTTAISISRIESIEHINRVIYFYISDKTIYKTKKASVTLNEISNQLLGHLSFISCHRGYIVNMNHVLSLSKNWFIMKSGAKIPVTSTPQNNVKTKYMEFLLGKG